MPAAVVLSSEQFHRHQQQGESLVAFIRRSPLVGADELELDQQRSGDLGRDIEL